ncbi:MAG TPA: hypothetical protein VL240_12660 [Candidatus Binatia bacterium]|nr:hypothetical protein [Candidatus Binatia bacterium]
MPGLSRFAVLALVLTLTIVPSAAQQASASGAGGLPTALQFVPLVSCRVIDTRGNGGPIQGGTARDIAVLQSGCGVPSNAAAYSLNVTVVPQGPLGYLTVWPTGEPQPPVSTMNSLDGRVKANAAIVPAGTAGDVSVYVSNTSNVILDIDGFFAMPTDLSQAFFPLPPCRVADTRLPNGYLGGPQLQGGHIRDFPVLDATSCNIPSTAKAYSLNLTAIPAGGAPLGYLTVWAAGLQIPLISTLNAPTGTVVANAALVLAGVGGDIQVYPSNNTDLAIDINGYFAAAGSGADPLSFYAVVPCRTLDTRTGRGQFSGELTVNVVNGPCGIPGTAQAYVLNATVVPSGSLGYLTLWPDSQPQPGVSTLNALDGAVTSNMAIVPTTNGSIDAFAANPTNLILDISGYFAP